MSEFLLFFLLALGIRCQSTLSAEITNCKYIAATTPLLKLKQYLFCNYDQEVRPTENYRNATIVRLGLKIYHFDVDEIANTIDLHVSAKMVWTDPHLTWTPSQYEGINFIRVMSYEIWLPDITLHSATNQYVDENLPTVQCSLYHEGHLICVPMMVYTTLCESDHTWWPYDLMNCSIHIASWSYNNNEIDIRSLRVQEDDQKVNENNLQWDVVDIFLSEYAIDSKFGLGFSSNLISYHILLKRHSSTYYGVSVMLAIVLMTMTLIALWLEPNSTERMTIANFNFLIHLLCLQDLRWKLTFNGSHSPKLLLFYENSLILATFSLILTSILRHLQQLNVDAPIWITSVSVSILKSRIGQILLTSVLDPNVSARMELNADDNTNLVSNNERSSTWKYVSILIGWLAFFTLLFTYIIMLILLLPTSKSANSFSLDV